MSQGTIKFFNAAKGFGFVTPDSGTADIFLPGAAVTAAGITAIRPGQRISFEQAPDTKGPKIVSLKLVGDAPAKAPAAQAPVQPRVTVYCDAGADVAAEIAEAVRAAGFALTMQDITTASADQLKRLSQMLSASSQGLVRRHDPLFFALQLDDRFITDQDFWTAIAEHPTLINGPVLVSAGRAKICKSGGEARAFLRHDEGAPKPKTLSPRMLAMLNGEALPPAEPAAAVEPPAPPAKRAPGKAATKSEDKAKPSRSAKPLAKKAAPAKGAAKKTAKKTAKPVKKAKSRAK